MLIFSRSEARRKIAHVAPVDAQRALGDVVKSRHQIRKRGFSRAAGSHQRHHFAGLHFQTHRIERKSLRCARIMETDIVKQDRFFKPRQLHRAGALLHLLIAVEIFETFCDAPSACWKMLWIPARRFTGSYSISSATTKP